MGKIKPAYLAVIGQGDLASGEMRVILASAEVQAPDEASAIDEARLMAIEDRHKRATLVQLLCPEGQIVWRSRIRDLRHKMPAARTTRP